ncbi:MAG TPA: DUF3795 domain-containing protein [Methanoregulaceae archaeon]|nr:DUF3795 domain-containing protein [Methanoregulaceae archaeon]
MQPVDEKDEVMVCGMICRECDHYQVECQGCRAVKGVPFWVAFVGIDRCPVYECCVEEKKIANCGQCEELPCDRFTRYKDPSVSGENAARTLESMVARLKELQQAAE